MSTSTVVRLARPLLLAIGLVGGLAIASAAPARADEQGAAGPVALVNHLEGQAAVQLAGTDTWVDDLVNRPLAGGDRLWIDEGSRAELHIGSMVLRLGPRSALRLVQVDDRQVRLRLTAGSMNVRLRSLDDDDMVTIETTAADFELLAPGGYRVDAVDQSDRAQFTVWSGRAIVRGPQLERELRNDEAIDIDADDDSPSIARADQPDRLDLWAEQRDRQEEESRAARYVPREMVGYAELDAYGDWYDDPMYGALWTPRYVAADWAPFRFGYWSFIGPWGWTWIDDAPWGFAPCHYGRWIRARNGWAWAPGPRRDLRRPVFSGAVVTWVGVPPGRHDDPRHMGRVGWAPLGHIGDPRFYTAVDRDTFVSARPVAPRRVNLPGNEWRRARPIDAPRIDPGEHSIGRVVPRDRVLPAPERAGPVPGRAVFDRGAGPGIPSAPGAGIRPRLPDGARDNADAQQRPVMRDRPTWGATPGAAPPVPAAREQPQRESPAWQRLPERGAGDAPGRGGGAFSPPPAQADVSPPPVRMQDRPAPRFERPEPPQQQYTRPEPPAQQYTRPEPRPQQYTRPEPPPQQYTRPEPAAQAPVFRAPPPQQYARPEPAPQPPAYRAPPSVPVPQAQPQPQRAAPVERASAPSYERRGNRDDNRRN